MNSTHHSPTHSHSMRFPSVGMEVLSAVIHLFGVSTLAFLLAKKIHWADISSRHALLRMTWPRLLVILNIVDSWLFLFSTGLLVNGTGMELNRTVCMLGIVNCIAFYASSKALIYLFLVEKVYVVWGGAAKKRRARSPVFLVCLIVVGVYVGVAIFLVLGRISYFREDGSCVIGLTRPASLTLLIYDLHVSNRPRLLRTPAKAVVVRFVNVFLTSLFVWPLLNRQINAPRLRRVAIRTLWAAAVALTTSCVNILVLTIMHGQQLAWVCLASCGTDVVVNAAVLSWVTSGKHSQVGGSYDSARDSTRKELDEVFIDCEPIASTSSARSDGFKFTRRRALSEPSRPITSSPRKGFSRFFKRAHARQTVETDLEGASAGHDADKADGRIEMLEHSQRSLSVLPPGRTYSSMLKRSNHSLRHHLNDSQVEIHVTQKTQILLNDTPQPSPAIRSKKQGRGNCQQTQAEDRRARGPGDDDNS
ncbi:hypothetical protein C8Q78DRAFT_966025 [Trametes maxima]|nr:hypothetical protein C8Q78DRAFT_966025 [Trametes maxima]